MLSKMYSQIWSGGLFYKAKGKPLLTAIEKKNRYSWTISKLSYTKSNWNKVIFSNESSFDVCVGDYYRKRVIRDKTEAFLKDYLKRTVKFPKGIMVWGCIPAKGLETFKFIEGTVNAAKYREIFHKVLLPSITKLYSNEDFAFQQDSASIPYSKIYEKNGFFLG